MGLFSKKDNVGAAPEKKELTEGQKRFLYLFLSFFLPFFVIMIALIGLQVAPFGNDTLLIADANGLYINTLSYASRMLRGLEGITYSFEKGLGGNMMGHLNGIMLTPFAFLLSFADIADYPVVFTFISTINLSLAGLTMYIFLADIYGHKRSNLIFSTSYALMGFQVANVFQACFYCAPPVLPIMALGLRRIFKGKSPLIYFFSIAYGMGSSAYFGYMLCAASFVFFLVGLWYYWEEIQNRRKEVILRYVYASVCGGLIVTFLWLPKFLSLQGGRLEQTSFADFSMWENMPFVEMGAKLFTGANDRQEEIDGLPNIFVGILPVALVILFFINKSIEARKKKAAGFLMGFYLVSFWIVSFNMIMHSGTTTNWFNYRNSYVFSFIALVTSSVIWQRIRDVSAEDIKKTAGLMILAALVIFSKKYTFVQGGMVFFDFVLLFLMYLMLGMHRRDPVKNTFRTFEIVIIELVCFNLLLNYSNCTLKLIKWSGKLDEYRSVVAPVNTLVQGVKAADDGFYRMEINRQRSGNTGNDPMLYGYNGVGHGGSNERNFVREELSKLGIPRYDMRNSYMEGVSAATDTLLGIKYLIAKEDMVREKSFDKITEAGDWKLYSNPCALPVAFTVPSDITMAPETDLSDIFENVNDAWKAVSGIDRNVFIQEPDIHFELHQYLPPDSIDAMQARSMLQQKEIDQVTKELNQTTPKPNGTEYIVSGNLINGETQEKPEDSAYLSYSWIADQDGPVYVYNAAAMMNSIGCEASAVQFVGCFKKGDEVRGYLKPSEGFLPSSFITDTAGRFRAAYADTEALSELSSAVKQEPVTVFKNAEDSLSGSFECGDERRILFTIPYDEGWTLYVDGKQEKLEKVFGVFMSAKAQKGKHSYTMKYEPPGLKTGLVVSGIAFLLMLLCAIAEKISKKDKKVCYSDNSTQQEEKDRENDAI